MGLRGHTSLAVALALSLVQPIESLDGRVQRAVQVGRRPAYESPMRAATRLGNSATVLGALLGIALFTGPAGLPTARAAVAVLLPLNAVVEVTKRGVGRTRPDREHDPDNASFPSSHAANAAALAVVLSRRWRRGMPWFVIAAAVVSWSRIYLNRHFLSDVLCGVMIGVAVAVLVLKWFASRGWLWNSRTDG
jgi:membrane-associated phospholipid phosphatase